MSQFKGTVSYQSVDTMSTSSIGSESDEFDEFSDMSPSPDTRCSPAASYVSMKSGQSINPPIKFQQDSDVSRASVELSPTPTLVSAQTEVSMDPPDNFTCRESYTSLLMQEHLRCSLCKDMLKKPVTIPCGHSFCRNCIISRWNKTAPDSCYGCPQCRKRFKTRPVLNLNFTLANVVMTQQHANSSAAIPTPGYAGPGDVACDSCSERKLRAVKSCLNCRESFCETHVRQHYTVESLSKHTLMIPETNWKQEVRPNCAPAKDPL